MIGQSECMRRIYDLILKIAKSGSHVVIYGESGTGKELVASTIHDMSNRGKNKFVPINCGAIPADLIESEFFGYKKGAFTGAASDKPGYLDWAEKGTLFMDEVGELSLNMQVKLLRFIDGGGYTPVGSQVVNKPDIRIIAATNDNLKDCVLQKKMREDFFYRLHILPINLPPLRQRKEDIPLLVAHFMQLFGKCDSPIELPNYLMRQLMDYDWPGNVRELQNTVRRYLAIGKIDFLNIPRQSVQQSFDTAEALKLATYKNGRDLQAVLQEAEKAYIHHVLVANGWHRGKTASILGINRKTLYKKINQYSLTRT
jgi:transcriptional regulator with PAS, ATPase and Fis domain